MKEENQDQRNYFALRRVFPDKEPNPQHNPPTFNQDNQQPNLKYYRY